MTEKDKNLEEIFLDETRFSRNFFHEVIFCSGKSLGQIIRTVQEMKDRGQNVFGTRLNLEWADKLTQEFQQLRVDSVSRTFSLIQSPPPILQGMLGLVAAGTSDVSVAEEAYQTAKFYGCEAKRFYDVGVAGLHRFFQKLPEIRTCDVVIVVAGMEGALPSVLGGLVSMPIIACPTSVGYGANLGGLATLAAMLSSCAEGITVVNIDNGFGAASAALRILRMHAKNLQNFAKKV